MSETTTLTKTAYRFTSHAHNNDNITVYDYGGDRRPDYNTQFPTKMTINLHHTRASNRYEIYTINEQYKLRVNITIKSL